MNKLIHLSKNLLTSGRSLLLPMLILALGVHAAILAVPLPSTEAQKEAEDKRTPIAVNQTPTEKPPAAKSTASVTIPPLDTATSPSTDSTTPSTTGDATSDASVAASSSDSSSSASSTSSNTSTSTSSPSASSSGGSASSASTASKSTAPKSDSAVDDAKPDEDESASTEKSAENNSETADASSTKAGEPTSDGVAIASTIATATAPSTTPSTAPSTTASNSPSNSAATNPFADFPHFQPSQKDCYGLGYGENCRTVENVEIAQIVDFFQKELAAKEFATSLVADEPTHKVFKVSRNNKTVFLNIWKGKQISYLLSDAVQKQAPEEIKTESPK